MITRTSHRRSVGLVPLIAAGLVLSACGGSDGEAASRPTVTLEAGETSYATLPPATTVPAVDETAEAEAGASPAQDYTVQAGDIGITIAERFGISLEELENANGWTDAGRELPFPGTVIRIPAGATPPAATPAAPAEGEAAPPAATPPADEAGATGEAIPEVGGNCEAGSYTIEAGDTSRFAVANKFDVTVEAMDAANASTNGYSAFYPGLQIVIPAKSDC